MNKLSQSEFISVVCSMIGELSASERRYCEKAYAYSASKANALMVAAGIKSERLTKKVCK